MVYKDTPGARRTTSDGERTDPDGMARRAEVPLSRCYSAGMAHLSPRLAPAARKLVVTAAAEQMVVGMVRVTPSTDRDTFRCDVERAGGVLRSWLGDANVASVEIDVGRLSTLADLPGVVYVETAQRYGR
jgi:hypothetical protein